MGSPLCLPFTYSPRRPSWLSRSFISWIDPHAVQNDLCSSKRRPANVMTGRKSCFSSPHQAGNGTSQELKKMTLSGMEYQAQVAGRPDRHERARRAEAWPLVITTCCRSTVVVREGGQAYVRNMGMIHTDLRGVQGRRMNDCRGSAVQIEGLSD